MNLLQAIAELKRSTKLIKSQIFCSEDSKRWESSTTSKPLSNSIYFGVGFGTNDPKKMKRVEPPKRSLSKEDLLNEAMTEARKHYSKSCIRPDEIDAMANLHEILTNLMYVPQRECIQKVLITTNKLLENEQKLINKIDDLVKKVLEMNIDRVSMGRNL